jgi:myo-inositol-1(or 4)-monophosphatase
MHPFVNTAVRAARKAGDTIVRGLTRFEGVETATKGLNDYVTNIDRAAEAEIIDILHTAYPHHAFLAEESGASGNADTTWIIDPLDGTTNFMHGFPQFAVSIACQVRDVIEHAVIYDPMRDEMWSVKEGHPALLNGQPISVSSRTDIAECTVSVGVSKSINTINRGIPLFEKMLRSVKKCRMMGSASLDIAYVSCGRLDAYIEGMISLWDVAAGLLLVEQAGGKVELNPHESQPEKYSIVASSGKVTFPLE